MHVIAAPYYNCCCFYEVNLCLRKLILFLFFRHQTPLHDSAYFGHLEVARLLVESKADVAARDRCFSPPPSHHLSLTICLAAMAKLHSNLPSTTTKPTLLHTCAASARRNDALPRLLRRSPANKYISSSSDAAVWPSQLPRRLSSRAQGLGRVSARQHWHFFQPLLLNATSKWRVVAMVQLLPGLQAMA